MSNIHTAERVDELLDALSQQLAAVGECYELVVIGGSGLLALQIVDRPTLDVDLLALRSGQELIKADPLPDPLVVARDRVSRDFGVANIWLNSGPSALLDFGLPDGFIDRLHTRKYGDGLVVHFASRLDQIHFKLYALVDQGPGKHESDLRALSPSNAELVQAARWTRTHDPSPGFKDTLEQALQYLGIPNADLRT